MTRVASVITPSPPSIGCSAGRPSSGTLNMLGGVGGKTGQVSVIVESRGSDTS